ncbi:MAG: signal peptidase I [Clostridia bacterium]|nr:signal peptidase I [Clostridia bacterium]
MTSGKQQYKIPRLNPFFLNVVDWVEVLIFSLSFVILLFTFIARLAVVDGPSMEKTLIEGEMLIVSDLGYTPKNNDVIVFQSPTSYFKEPIVKRVIAKAGQTVDIDFRTWTVSVDGEKLDESYVNFEGGYMYNPGYLDYPYTVPDGMLFCMGDNRNHSSDSRSREIGPVDERFVLGKVIFRLTPLSKIGAVK